MNTAATDLDAALSAALRWLYATSQPASALVARRGTVLAAAARTLRIVPIGPAGTPLIVVDAAESAHGDTGLALNTLPQDERPALTTELTRLGIPVQAHHYHAITGIITLDVPAHPSLRAAVPRLDAGCPHHHSRRCHKTVGDGGYSCPWRAEGHRVARWPPGGAAGPP